MFDYKIVQNFSQVLGILDSKALINEPLWGSCFNFGWVDYSCYKIKEHISIVIGAINKV